MRDPDRPSSRDSLPPVPYGMWPSPLSPEGMAGQLRLEDVQWDSDGRTLVWLEGRSGRSVLVCRSGQDAPRDLTDDLDVSAGVGYGGGDFTVGSGLVIFAGGGRLQRLTLNPARPHPITPEFGACAAPALSPDGSRVLYVHSYENNDALALVDSEGRDWPVRLAHGADFYMQPAWHPDGRRIAWIEWDHPQMPWDGTRLRLARLEGATLSDVRTLAGDADTPVFQPAFSPDGRFLAWLTQTASTDRLVVHDLKTGRERILHEAVALLPPAWSQGMRVFAWSADSRRILLPVNQAGFFSLWSVPLDGSPAGQLEIGPYTWIEQLAASPQGEELAFLGSSPAVPPRLVTLAPDGLRIERRTSSETLSAEDLPQPRPLEWTAPDGTRLHGLYYPPTSRAVRGEGLPPAVVNIHGGPTSQRGAHFNPDAAFFATRGYAYLEVNYRGSTGYGRGYMLALRGKWGLLDVEDALGGAQALVDGGLADPRRLVIKGGSAGGYTVLNALVRHPGFFRAGLNLFGVSQLMDFAIGTHKFESHYNDSLVGVLPGDAERFRAWSPALHADAIRDPLAVFQGADDRVVPPAHSEIIVAALQRNHVPHLYRLYAGEGHGFRKAETIRAFYSDVETFLREHVLAG